MQEPGSRGRGWLANASPCRESFSASPWAVGCVCPARPSARLAPNRGNKTRALQNTRCRALTPLGSAPGTGAIQQPPGGGKRSPPLQDTPCKGASPCCPCEGSPAATRLPCHAFWAPGLQRDPQQGPAHGNGLSHSSSAGKVQGRRRRRGDAWLCPGLGARAGGPPAPRDPPRRGNGGRRSPGVPWAHAFQHLP